VKRRTRLAAIVTLAGRVAVWSVALCVLVLAGVQFARVVDRNVALAHELSSTNADVSTLEVREQRQRQNIQRLKDPEGAVPEIHDRLRLVKPNEEIIFLSPAPSASPAFSQ
jgi:cell division protein FtsB